MNVTIENLNGFETANLRKTLVREGIGVLKAPAGISGADPEDGSEF